MKGRVAREMNKQVSNELQSIDAILFSLSFLGEGRAVRTIVVVVVVVSTGRH